MPLPDLPSSQSTVLVVEDDKPILDFIVGVLTRQGHRVLSAGDGAEGLRILTEHPEPFHLMICDNRMPRLSGGELLQRIAPTRADLNILFLSAADVVVPPRLKFATLLAKPFRLDGFLAAVREALPGSRHSTA